MRNNTSYLKYFVEDDHFIYVKFVGMNFVSRVEIKTIRRLMTMFMYFSSFSCKAATFFWEEIIFVIEICEHFTVIFDKILF